MGATWTDLGSSSAKTGPLPRYLTKFARTTGQNSASRAPTFDVAGRCMELQLLRAFPSPISSWPHVRHRDPFRPLCSAADRSFPELEPQTCSKDHARAWHARTRVGAAPAQPQNAAALVVPARICGGGSDRVWIGTWAKIPNTDPVFCSSAISGGADIASRATPTRSPCR